MTESGRKHRRQSWKRTLVFFAVLGVLALGAVFGAIFWKQEQVVISVNGDGIYAAELARLEAQLRLQDPSVSKPFVYQQAVAIKLLLQEAKRRNISLSDGDLEQALHRMEVVSGQPLREAFRGEGVRFEDFEEMIKDQLLARRVINDTIKTITVSEKEIVEYFKQNQELYAQGQYYLKQIVVADEAAARRVKDKLDRGLDFSIVANELSIDPATREKGGDIGYVAYAELVPEIQKVVAKIEGGGVTEPVKVGGAYYVVKVIERKNITLNDARVSIAYQLSEKKAVDLARKLLKDLWNHADIKIFDEKVKITKIEENFLLYSFI